MSCSVKEDQNGSCVSVRSIAIAAMLAAAVVTAGVTSLALLMVMVVTVNLGVVAQISAEQCAHRRVNVPADTAVELDARFGHTMMQQLSLFVKVRKAFQYPNHNISIRKRKIKET